ncbi:uncharacterized protein LACBIDRAFT_328829 [Laccaria bicolor S238N-H82]|uniref:Predicted protein n=1 Tax=Laccaria bicolor (strain S238N-H82 / ATCC MYA-4686) TaxID=486041 RepID=B0DG43_LACBS|nr:uncharacterized protein LACBIDRAFT_328829 [Laccaria bicolor S238N-H82]EDR06577.1 predicted protein [Laccaria bicolor S238N-H82]|eukprot:XP_001882949.1 predicted protein [Laccaria bicolor S238N-H82]
MSYYQDLKPEGIDNGLATLCLTCKLWNDLAVSTPELWSFIEIIRGSICTSQKSLPSYSKVSTWLDRSRSWPLSFAVIGEWFSPEESTSVKAILPLLLAHSHRWRRISLGFGYWFEPMHVWNLPHTFIAPILESVEVICDTYERDHIFYGRLLRGCPALCSFTSNQREYYMADLPPGYFPWEQLRNLEVVNPTDAANALTLLGRAVNLHSYCLTIALDSPWIKGPSLKSVTSPIKFLTMKIYPDPGYRENVELFFRFLDACNLTSLSIGYVQITHDNLSDILSKPRLRLSSLTLRNIEILEDEFLDRLTLLSESITTLEILRNATRPTYYGAVKNRIINLLTFHGEGSPKPLCPFLETLTLERCIEADDGLFARMVRSRRRSPRTLRDNGIALLKRLDVVFVHSMHSLDEEGLKEMYGEGLQGHVKFFI